MILDKVKMKVSIFADFIVGLLGDFKNRIVLFAAKLVFDAVLRMYFPIIIFLSLSVIYKQGTIRICFECRKAKYLNSFVMNTRTIKDSCSFERLSFLFCLAQDLSLRTLGTEKVLCPSLQFNFFNVKYIHNIIYDLQGGKV